MKIETHGRLIALSMEGVSERGVALVLECARGTKLIVAGPRDEADGLLSKLGQLVAITIDTDKEVK